MILIFRRVSFLTNISSSSATDAELIQQYKQSGDLQWLGALYGRYMELVYGVCLKYLNDPEEAKDAVMELFDELQTKLQKHEVEHFRARLYQVAKNYCLMQLRTGKKMVVVKMEAALVQSAAQVHLNGELEHEENWKQLEHCLAQLSSEQRQIVELFYLQGKCYNEIAAVTGLDWNRVRSHLQNGRRNLKLCIEKQKEQAT